MSKVKTIMELAERADLFQESQEIELDSIIEMGKQLKHWPKLQKLVLFFYLIEKMVSLFSLLKREKFHKELLMAIMYRKHNLFQRNHYLYLIPILIQKNQRGALHFGIKGIVKK